MTGSRGSQRYDLATKRREGFANHKKLPPRPDYSWPHKKLVLQDRRTRFLGRVHRKTLQTLREDEVSIEEWIHRFRDLHHRNQISRLEAEIDALSEHIEYLINKRTALRIEKMRRENELDQRP